MKRRLALLALLVASVALTGCAGLFGPDEPDQERLGGNASYDWETNATVSITVNRSSFEGVYDLTNQSSLTVYRRGELGEEHRLPISALRYRYENGTVVEYSNDSSVLTVTPTSDRVTIDVPNGTTGQIAFTAPRHGKRFTTQVFLQGSHAVTLPPNARVGIPLLSQVSPRGYETDVDGDRMTIRWENVTSQRLSVRYYLQRDLLLFAGVVGVSTLVGSSGALYYYYQIRRLKRRREEHGLDVDEDDDPRDRGPPPGMR